MQPYLTSDFPVVPSSCHSHSPPWLPVPQYQEECCLYHVVSVHADVQGTAAVSVWPSVHTAATHVATVEGLPTNY